MKKKGLLTTSLLLGAAAGTVLLLEKNRRKVPTTLLSPDAPVRSKHTIRIAASAERSWQVLSDINHWTAWQPDLAYAHLHGRPETGTRFDWSSSGYLPIHSTITTAEPGKAFGWSGTSFGAFAVHNWHFITREDYTEVTSEETIEGWLATLLQRVMQPGLDKGNARWLEYLKEKAEQAG